MFQLLPVGYVGINPVTGSSPIGYSGGAREKSFWYIEIREHPSLLSFCPHKSPFLLRQEREAHRLPLMPLVLVVSLNSPWETMGQVLFSQRLACPARGQQLRAVIFLFSSCLLMPDLSFVLP